MLGLILGCGVPLGYLTAWTLTARTLYRRYHLKEGEKRNCPHRREHPEWHRQNSTDICVNSTDICVECSRVNKQWWQSVNGAAARGLSDVNLAWDCIVQSFIPPVTLAVYLMFASVMANPPLSPREAQARDAAQRKRIEELEAELDAKMSAAAS